MSFRLEPWMKQETQVTHHWKDSSTHWKDNKGTSQTINSTTYLKWEKKAKQEKHNLTKPTKEEMKNLRPKKKTSNQDSFQKLVVYGGILPHRGGNGNDCREMSEEQGRREHLPAPLFGAAQIQTPTWVSQGNRVRDRVPLMAMGYKILREIPANQTLSQVRIRHHDHELQNQRNHSFKKTTWI